MEQKFDNFSVQQAMELIRTPEGKQLINLLQKSSGARLQSAMSKASSGDYSQAKDLINEFLSTPQAQDLLRRKKE